MPNSGGTIYAIGAVGTSYVKIGSTRAAVERRLRALQVGQPFPLQILATVPVEDDLHRIEKQVHTFLEEERRRGEWFEIPMDLATLEALIVQAVASLAAQEPLADEANEHGFDARVFGDRLRSTRKGLGLSQEQVAEALGTAHGWISELETGRRPQVQAQTLYRLCEILHVSADYLLGLQENAQAEKPPAPRPRTRKAAPVG